jgi:Domain of unknown function (DUF4389)
MVIPQVFVLVFVGLAAFFASIAGWFAALFLGRLPEGLRDFLAGVLRWSTRVQGYLFLLTDQYPPYSLGEEYEYPVRVAIPPPLRLNRAAVLFRIVLAIPAWIVASVVNSGLLLVSIGSWFMILVTGRLPVPLYEATRATVRYQTRFYGYFSMLTPEYPWGVIGDGSPSPTTVDPYEFWSVRLSSGGRAAMIVVIVLGVLSEVNQYRGRL